MGRDEQFAAPDEYNNQENQVTESSDSYALPCTSRILSSLSQYFYVGNKGIQILAQLSNHPETDSSLSHNCSIRVRHLG